MTLLKSKTGKFFTSIAKGVVAGAVATYVMDRVTWFIYERQDIRTRVHETLARTEMKDPAHALVSRFSRATGLQIDVQQPNPAGIGVHYAVGILPVVAYSLMRGRVPFVGKTRGLLFGTAVFALVDEAMSPMLGIANRPGAYPWQAHARGLAGHLAYGLTADTTLRGFERLGRRLERTPPVYLDESSAPYHREAGIDTDTRTPFIARPTQVGEPPQGF